MALSISNKKTSVFGNKRISKFDVAFGASYPTGGEALSLSTIGLNEVDIVMISQKSGYVLEYDYTNNKVLAYRSPSHSHDLVFKANAAANAVTMAANSLRNASAGDLTVAGGGADGGISNSAQLALAEVANATDLSALTGVRVLAIGV